MSKVVDVSGKLEHIARIKYKLSLLARRFLCIPATSDSSERMVLFFFTAGATVTKLRASLDSDDKLVFCCWNKRKKLQLKLPRKLHYLHPIQILFRWNRKQSPILSQIKKHSKQSCLHCLHLMTRFRIGWLYYMNLF